MLQGLRNAAKEGFLKYILLGFLVAAGFGLVLMDVGGFFRGGVPSNVVAKAGSMEIGVREFDNAVRRILARQGLTPSEAYQYGLITSILNNEIQTRLLHQEAIRLGIQVPDENVLAQISEIAEPLVSEGASKKEALQTVLRSQGIREAEFIEAIRQEIGNSLLRNSVLNASYLIPDSMARNLYIQDNEIRDIKTFTLKTEDVADITEPTDDNLQNYYEAIKSDYLIPEERSLTIATLKKEMLSGDIEITDEEARAVYDENIAVYELPERRVIEQAVLVTQSDANDVFKRVEAGKSIKAVVQSVTGNTNAYLGEEEFKQNGLLDEIGEPVFAAAKGDVLGPIQTALGWHILKLNNILQPETIAFEKVKEQLKEEILETRLMDDIIEAANTLDDRLASGESLEDVIGDMGLTSEIFEQVLRNGFSAKAESDVFESYGIDRTEIIETAFTLEPEEVSPALELDDGRFIVIRADSIQEQSYQPFENVADNVQEKWVAQQKKLTNRTRALDASGSVGDEKTIDDVAKELGAKVQKYAKIRRDTDPKAGLTPGLIAQAFDTAMGTAFITDVPEGIAVSIVTNIGLPDEDSIVQDDLDALKETLESEAEQELFQTYITSLQSRYRVKINDRILAQMYAETQF